MTRPIVRTLDLQEHFGKQNVLRGINLEILQGQVVGLIGTNGSGKSTLIKCLLGLLKRSSGQSFLFDEDSWDLTPNTKARLGYVSQEFQIFPWMKVQQVCDYTGAFYEHWNYAHVKQLLSEWSLPSEKRVSTLSVGQRQKLAVILAMGHQPELLILDEPVASLDPVARRQFLQSLIEFTADGDNTVLFSTHITSDLERIASHVAFLSEGTLGYYGELDQLKDNCKRLRIHAFAPLPDDLRLPKTLRSEIDGTHGLITVAEFQPELRPLLAEQYQAQVNVEDLNLEEIFLELNGHSSAAQAANGASR
ncbi:ABC transporter ATP-binding protein [Planctomicrobium sp. SH527]|uniref:ABC transporter ATP-binding protein n=1 Tax=Planctomicrobium sp. SH527 TaxID=3448123 RepID=UPI003F5C3FAB